MKQLIQNFKTGELFVDDVPPPTLSSGMVLVANKFSLISAGTEKSTVSVGQASLLGKARQRPDLVNQVLQNIRKEGLKATFDKVRTKLDSLKALGYSTAGTVIASMDNAGQFKPGDRVACAGQDYASHAEIVCVPQNLVTKIPASVPFDHASFTTLGAIALQGVRQANPSLGDNVCVIGLGLLGQLTCQILRANGCNVVGVDISAALVELAHTTSCHAAFSRSDDNLIKAIENFSGGYGVDTVIVTAAAPTNDPIVLATEILRRKGVVVIVGAVRMDIPRDPYFYRKELELKISTSYGPGRYDPEYEENGHDYPYAYVRWTEQRNMAAFLRLLETGAVDVKPLISHVFTIEQAEQAYDIVLGKVKEPYTGIVLSYSGEQNKCVTTVAKAPEATGDGIAFLGAGSFAQSYLIPHVKRSCSLDTVVTSTGINANNVAKKYGFSKASTVPDDVITNQRISTVFIATRHDSHANFATRCLEAGKHVFVEKPVALTVEQLQSVKKAALTSRSVFMVGFNRRFSPLIMKGHELFKTVGEPLVVSIRVNAGFIPKEHWTQQLLTGGGRIIGEVCHFIDLMQFIVDANPTRVFAERISSVNSNIKDEDNFSASIAFSNGAVGNLVYVANGDKSLPKERIEVFGGNSAFVIDDFKEGTWFRNNKAQSFKLPGKGHQQEVEAFLSAVKGGLPSPIALDSIISTTMATFAIHDSLATGLPQEIVGQ